MKTLFTIFMFFTNTAVPVFSGIGIYSFSQSYIWAIVGAVFFTGSLLKGPLIVLVAYPCIEWAFHGSLTKYSAIIVGITLLHLASCVYVTKKIGVKA